LLRGSDKSGRGGYALRHLPRATAWGAKPPQGGFCTSGAAHRIGANVVAPSANDGLRRRLQPLLRNVSPAKASAEEASTEFDAMDPAHKKLYTDKHSFTSGRLTPT